MTDTADKPRITRCTRQAPIYRDCSCGENAHDWNVRRIEGRLHRIYECRNCKRLILGPVLYGDTMITVGRLREIANNIRGAR
jgi:hypothetical protein